MTGARLRDMLQMQLTRDYNCFLEDFDRTSILLTSMTRHPERRRFEDEDSIANAVLHEGKLIVTVEDEFFDSAEQYFSDADDTDGEWFFDTYDCIAFNELLNSFGYELGPARVGYIPKAGGSSEQNALPPSFVLLEGKELQRFRGDERFNEALLFSEITPDMLAIAKYSELGEIIGMAGASRNSPDMWELGVNVLPEARRVGVGSELVRLVAAEVQRRGHLPYFNCCMSHIAAQRTALAAGLVPAFCEVRSRRLEYESPFEDEE